MKQRTENYVETENMIGWLTCTAAEVKRHVPQADTETLCEALKIAHKKGEVSKMKAIKREMFYRLEPGDMVMLVPFEMWAIGEKGRLDFVKDWVPSGKFVRLENSTGRWGWDDLHIIIKRENTRLTWLDRINSECKEKKRNE